MNYVDLISSVGFPITCVVGMAWYINKLTGEFQKTVISISERHNKEVTELKVAIDNLAEKISEVK